MRNVPGLETVYRDYAAKGVRFFYIYKALMHPETNGYVAPFTQDERLLHVKEAQRTLGSEVPWLCDSMANTVKHSLGDAPNSEFIIDPKGIVVVRRAWSDPKQLRLDLERLVGPAERVTQVNELNLKLQPPPKGSVTGVVPRLKLDGKFEAVLVKPQPSRQPFYVKLRAEADDQLLQRGEGKLYLGFLLDPLYHVHWNNLAAPLKFVLQVSETAAGGPSVSESVELSPASGVAPKVNEPADSDPREFLVSVKLNSTSRPNLRLKVDYYACHDEQGWCNHIVQEYEIELERDRDGGWVQWRRRAQRAAAEGLPLPAEPLPAASLPRPSGTVIRVHVEARTLTMRGRMGNERTVKVDDKATVSFNGRAGTLADLQAGDHILVELARPEETSEPVIVRIVARRF